MSEVVRFHDPHTERYGGIYIYCYFTITTPAVDSPTKKGSTCLCRPLYKVPADMNEAGQPTPPASVAPPISSPGPCKVQKSARRHGSLQAAPENIEKALNLVPEFQNQQQIDSTTPNHMSSHSPGFNTDPRETSSPGFKPPVPQMPSPALNITASTTSQTQSSDCCSKKAQKESQPAKQPVDRVSSCCGKSTNSQVGTSNGSESSITEQGNPSQILNGMSSYPAFSTPQISSWQQYNSTGQGHFNQLFMLHQTQPQTPVYLNGYMPDPAQTPLMSFPHQNFSDATDLSQPPLPGNSQSLTYTQALASFGDDSSHICTCGDACQCLGCASHPFNDRTRQYVQEMGAMVTLGEKDGNLEGSNGYRTSPFPGKANAPSALDFTFANSNHHHLDTGAVQGEATPTYPEQAPNSNFDNRFSSPFSPEYTPGLLMEPEEYYTLEYPVGLPNSCSDVTGSCQCGNDCCCTGCLTHSGHNGEPVTTTQNTSLNTTGLSNPSPPDEQLDLESARFPVLDNLSASSLSPRAVEPQIS